MRTGLDAVSNPRLLRAVRALRRSFTARTRKEFEEALVRCTLLVEGRSDPRGINLKLPERGEGGAPEQPVFSDLEAYRRWRPAPGGRLIAVNSSDLLQQIVHSRNVDGGVVTLDPADPRPLRLRCSGAALLLRGRYPVFVV